MGHDDAAKIRMRIRRGVVLGVIITAVLFIMGLTHVGEAFALEYRVYGYVIYESGEVVHVSYVPLYIYMWRISSLLFLAWLLSYIAYVIKPSVVLDASGVVYGAFYVVTHYVYLFTIGAPVILYPFMYMLVTVGKPLLYLDWGQVIGAITIWRIYTIMAVSRGYRS